MMKHSSTRINLFFLLVALLLISGTNLLAQESDAMADLPESIEIEAPGILPEGVVFDEAGERFLVGSLSQGTIFEVQTDGTITPFIEDDDLISTVGIHIDAENNRLLVPVSNSVVFSGEIPPGPLAMLAAYDLETGERIFLTDLSDMAGEIAFANDVTVDSDGNTYVTDSFSPKIYVVNSGGEASVFVEHELLAVPADAPIPISLNGIDFHPDGYLLVANTGAESIVVVPIDNPDEASQVELPTPAFIDGMVLTPENDLVAVANVPDSEGNVSQAVVLIHSDDDWATAEIVESYETSQAGTTITQYGDTFYMINAYLNNPSQEVYELVRFDFGMMEEDE